MDRSTPLHALERVHHLQRAECRHGAVMIRDDRRTRRKAAGLDDPGADHSAAAVRSVRLPDSSVEPVYGLNPPVLLANLSDYHPDYGRPAPQHRSTLQPDRISLPARSPGQHLHPQLRRPSSDGPCAPAGSST